MRLNRLLFIPILVFFSATSWAGIQNAASCSLADVIAAYNAALPGDTVQIPAGSATWSSGLTISKSIVLQGMGVSSTVLTNGGINSMINISPSSDVPIRVTGIYFDNVINTGATKAAIGISGKRDGSFALTQIRIDHNTFHKGKWTVNTYGWVCGVIDSNTFVDCDIAVGTVGDDDRAWTRSIQAGTANSLFIEDNTFIMDNNSDVSLNEQVYHSEGGMTVVRHNTFDGTARTSDDSLFIDSHGNIGYYVNNNNDFRGQPIIEIYNNTMNAHHTYRFIHLRGGSTLVHDNTFGYLSGSKPPSIQMDEEEDWQTSFFSPLRTVWPAQDQVNNSFFWNNTINGAALVDGDDITL